MSDRRLQSMLAASGSSREAATAQMSTLSKESSEVDHTEWKLRCDLAACYQLTELYGMSYFAGTHISVRIPGPEEHFLLNPYDLLFEEITASSLIKVDLDGKVISGQKEQLNPAAFTIHSAIHRSRSDAMCVMHAHTRAIIAVGAQKAGLLPISQTALMIWDFLTYHDYEGVSLDYEERDRIVEHLGKTGRCMILRNHGALTVGSIAEAFSLMLKLETACQIQVDALAGNHELIQLDDSIIKHGAAQGRKIQSANGYAHAEKRDWPALLRKLERERGTSYRT
jgi:ribulose-5-phosphate 4-epimerase/fuculose-1-phosphate aldolase